MTLCPSWSQFWRGSSSHSSRSETPRPPIRRIGRSSIQCEMGWKKKHTGGESDQDQDRSFPLRQKSPRSKQSNQAADVLPQCISISSTSRSCPPAVLLCQSLNRPFSRFSIAAAAVPLYQLVCYKVSFDRFS